MDDITDPALDVKAPPTSAPRIAGYRYPTPTGEPCPRTVRVDGLIEFGGNCQSCGTCLLYGGVIDAKRTPRVGGQQNLPTDGESSRSLAERAE